MALGKKSNKSSKTAHVLNLIATSEVDENDTEQIPEVHPPVADFSQPPAPRMMATPSQPEGQPMPGQQPEQQYPPLQNQAEQQHPPLQNQAQQQHPPLQNQAQQQYPPLQNQAQQPAVQPPQPPHPNVHNKAQVQTLLTSESDLSDQIQGALTLDVAQPESNNLTLEPILPTPEESSGSNVVALSTDDDNALSLQIQDALSLELLAEIGEPELPSLPAMPPPSPSGQATAEPEATELSITPLEAPPPTSPPQTSADLPAINLETEQLEDEISLPPILAEENAPPVPESVAEIAPPVPESVAEVAPPSENPPEPEPIAEVTPPSVTPPVPESVAEVAPPSVTPPVPESVAEVTPPNENPPVPESVAEVTPPSVTPPVPDVPFVPPNFDDLPPLADSPSLPTTERGERTTPTLPPPPKQAEIPAFEPAPVEPPPVATVNEFQLAPIAPDPPMPASELPFDALDPDAFQEINPFSVELNPMRDRLPTEPIAYYNLTETLVRELTPQFMKQFSKCTCEQCLLDVLALTLSSLPPKYIVRHERGLVSAEQRHHDSVRSAVVAQLGRSCIQVNENPRHADNL